MRLIRFEDGGGAIRWGEPVGEREARLLKGDLFGPHEITDEALAVRRVLAPLAPVNVIAIGLNYRRHAEESGMPLPDAPLIFVKLTTAVIGPGEPILLPTDAPDEVDYEAELAVVIGRAARKVSERDALSHVLGYTCANDVSARDCQVRRDKQWARAKGFDTFCPLGPCIVTGSAIDPGGLAIRARLNGEVVQDSNTSDLIFSVPQLISYLSHQFTLLPGTVILTGTPEGVGHARNPPRYLREGDTIAIEIDGIGELVNPVQRDR
jgi:2-keto-4-pentenoate hydratase/2-oxohepta-3-ene-1,7-dioic acid hydratase in catechol pathway